MISRAGIQREELASHLSSRNWHTEFWSVGLFISMKKKSTHTAQVASTTTFQYCNLWRTFLRATYSESFWIWIQNLRFPWLLKQLFFSNLLKLLHLNVRFGSKSPWEIFQLSITIFKDHQMAVQTDHNTQPFERSERRQQEIAERLTDFRPTLDSLSL